MTYTPERLIVEPSTICDGYVGDMRLRYESGNALYVRADLYEAVMKDRAETYACLIACTAQRDDLKRQVATIRREALEEAAKVCDELAEDWVNRAKAFSHDSCVAFNSRADGAETIARLIRALIEVNQ